MCLLVAAGRVEQTGHNKLTTRTQQTKKNKITHLSSGVSGNSSGAQYRHWAAIPDKPNPGGL
eukprot:1846457-Lingulodinium_polyedra.AAC.1